MEPLGCPRGSLFPRIIYMPFFVTVGVLFTLALLGIVVYFKCTSKGRKADVGCTLEDAHLEDKLMDSVEETKEVLEGLQARKEALVK